MTKTPFLLFYTLLGSINFGPKLPGIMSSKNIQARVAALAVMVGNATFGQAVEWEIRTTLFIHLPY